MSQRVQTNFEIIESSYAGETTQLTLINIGSTKVDTELMDVYVNGDKINRNEIEFNIYNQTASNLLWGPTEALNISFTQSLSGRNLIQVSSQYGISAYTQIIE